MSKELEALKNVRENIWIIPMKYIDETIHEKLDIIKRALTPSTQEEVCEALSAYFKKEVKIDKRYKDIVFTCDNRNIVMVDNNSIRISQWLPPKLGKMIFAFYEGVEQHE